ncbi:hypothetical protein KJ359_003419 [Pestalotiopsis sp. 9143b]|nr:hypothetical protein KJ359_003419 [Pestalotiopsis sp. 9143b]
MAPRQKVSGSDGASTKHGGGIRTIFDRFRSTKRSHPDTFDDEHGSIFTAEDVSSSPVQRDQRFRMEREMRRRQARVGGIAKAPTSESLSGTSLGSASASASASSSGFFNKLLHRPAKANKKTTASHSRASQDSSELRSGESKHSLEQTQPHRKRRSIQAGQVNTEKPVKRQLSRIDHKLNHGDDRRQSQVYIPSFAMTDNPCTEASRSLKNRYSIIDEDEGRRLSLLFGGLSPPPRDTESCSPCSFLVDDVYRDQQRRLTIATLEGISNVDTDSSIGGNDVFLMDTLHPPPMASFPPQPTRRSLRRSYSRPEDYLHIAEEPAEESDYQRFIQRAYDQERWDQDQKRRGITSHPNPGKQTCSLQRSGTFGGSRRERSRSMMRDEPGAAVANAAAAASRKRASYYSYHSRDNSLGRNSYHNNKRRSYVGVEAAAFEPLYTPPPPSARDLRKSTSAARRLSDYFRPHRDVINGYEMPENERLRLSMVSVV